MLRRGTGGLLCFGVLLPGVTGVGRSVIGSTSSSVLMLLRDLLVLLVAPALSLEACFRNRRMLEGVELLFAGVEDDMPWLWSLLPDNSA